MIVTVSTSGAAFALVEELAERARIVDGRQAWLHHRCLLAYLLVTPNVRLLVLLVIRMRRSSGSDHQVCFLRSFERVHQNHVTSDETLEVRLGKTGLRLETAADILQSDPF